MPTFRILCLHGQGSNAAILHFQLSSIIKSFQADNMATFDFAEGMLQTGPGPGVPESYGGPFYSFYNWPPTFSDEDEESIEAAYENLEEYLGEEGPFDGILGFSHGGCLLAGFLEHYSLHNPFKELPIRFAIFISSMPPFRVEELKQPTPTFLHNVGTHIINIPTIHVIGKKDFVYDYSKALYSLCQKDLAIMVTHNRGHEVPTDAEFLREMNMAFHKLSMRIACGW